MITKSGANKQKVYKGIRSTSLEGTSSLCAAVKYCAAYDNECTGGGECEWLVSSVGEVQEKHTLTAERGRACVT